MLGVVAIARGDVEGGLSAFRRAVELEPGHAVGRLYVAAVLMYLGDYAAGFAEFARIIGPEGPIRWAPGEPVAGRKVLIADGYGIGDSVLFCCYVPVLASRGARITIATTWAPQARLFERLPGVDRVLVVDDPAALADGPEWGDAMIGDFWALPWLLGVDGPGQLAEVPYLIPDPADIALWRARLPDDGRLRVGIGWGSSEPWPPYPLNRSLPLNALAPLGRVPGVHLYSLQFGRPAAALADPPFEMTDLAPSIVDTAETVAVAGLMDVVISNDSGLANLAAAAGMPTWVLLRAGALGDWRFGVAPDEYSPWYPTARRFPQRAPGDWSAPVAQVADELRQLMAQRGVT